jgi:spore coat polysaccharide biosynthesis protein SpsF
MRVGAIALARFDSSRLPGKALREVAGVPMLRHVLEICRRIRGVDAMCLATTDRPVDDRLAALAHDAGFEVHRGSADHVAERFLGAMRAFGYDAAVRVNGDSPLHRHDVLACGVASFRDQRPDLVTNVQGRTYPFGVTVEVVGREAMTLAVSAMTEPAHREHVTPYLYEHPETFRIVPLPPGPEEGHGVRMTVDNPAELEAVRRVACQLGDRLYDATLVEVIALVRTAGARAMEPTDEHA